MDANNAEALEKMVSTVHRHLAGGDPAQESRFLRSEIKFNLIMFVSAACRKRAFENVNYQTDGAKTMTPDPASLIDLDGLTVKSDDRGHYVVIPQGTHTLPHGREIAIVQGRVSDTGKLRAISATTSASANSIMTSSTPPPSNGVYWRVGDTLRLFVPKSCPKTVFVTLAMPFFTDPSIQQEATTATIQLMTARVGKLDNQTNELST